MLHLFASLKSSANPDEVGTKTKRNRTMTCLSLGTTHMLPCLLISVSIISQSAMMRTSLSEMKMFALGFSSWFTNDDF